MAHDDGIGLGYTGMTHFLPTADHFDFRPTAPIGEPVLEARPDGGDLSLGTTDDDYQQPIDADVTGMDAHLFDQFFSLGKIAHDDETAQYAVTWNPTENEHWLFVLNGDGPMIQHNGVVVDWV